MREAVAPDLSSGSMRAAATACSRPSAPFRASSGPILVQLEQGPTQGGTQLGGIKAQAPCPLQVFLGPLRLTQGQPRPADGVLARCLGEGAPVLNVLGQAGHPAFEIPQLGPQIMRWGQLQVPGQGLDALRRLGEALGLGGLSLGPQALAHREPAEDGHGQHHGGRGHHQHGVLPGPVDRPLQPGGRPGLDGLAFQDALQVLPQGAGSGVPAARILLEAGEYHSLQVGRERGQTAPKRNGVIHDDVGQALEPLARKGRRPRQQGLERGAQRVHVRAAVQQGGLAAGLFRGHVGHGADDPAPALGAPGQTEVEHAGPAGAVLQVVDHQVGGLQVPMDEPHPVCGMDPFADIHHVAKQSFERQGGRGLLEGLPAEELHGDVGLAAPFPHLVHPAHVGVIDPGLELGLLEEPLEQVGVLPAQQLQGHHAMQGGIRGLEDAPHAPFADQLEVLEAGPVCQGADLEDIALAEAPGRIGMSSGGARGIGVRGVPFRWQGRLGRDLHGPVAGFHLLQVGQVLEQPLALLPAQSAGGHQGIQIGVPGLLRLQPPTGHRQGQGPLTSR